MPKLPDVLTTEEQEKKRTEQVEADHWKMIEATAAQLTTDKGKTVVPVTFPDPDVKDGFIDGYLYEPDDFTDAKLLAGKMMGPAESIPMALNALESLFIAEASDERLRQKKYRNGIAMQLLKQVEYELPILKKK